ncbi:MAG: glycosyltransferase [Candidatus Saccharimonadales bacterium]
MNDKLPLVSIVIVNWNGLEDTKQCLKSIGELHYENIEIIVVDNGSVDGSKEYLSALDDIIYIDLPTNTGFTGGHIAGKEVAKGDFIILVNNDLVMDPEWINHALDSFNSHPDAAVVGGKQYMWNDENPAQDATNDYFAFQEVDQSTGNTYTSLVGEEERSVDAISGACMMVKTESLKKVGYLDDDFFTYYEETDLTARLLRAGYRTYYNPRAVAWHKVAASTTRVNKKNSYYLYMMHRNRYMYAIKNFDNKFVREFRRNYFKEVTRSLLRPLKSSIQVRIRAYVWNKLHMKQHLYKRQKIMPLGETYNNHLNEYEPRDATFIIPCYNYGNYVQEAIDSALRQTIPPKKVLIINDGSTDNSRAVIDTYKDNPLVEIIHQQNKGVVATKNLGIEKTSTYWTIFLDADDKIENDYVEKLINTAHSGGYAIVYTDMKVFGATNDVIKARPFNIRSMLQRSYVHNSSLIKTSYLKQIGGYKEEMRDGVEDWELYLTLYEAGAKFGYHDEPIFSYRYHDSSMSRNTQVAKREMEFYRRIAGLHPELFGIRAQLQRRLSRIWYLTTLLVKNPLIAVAIARSAPRALRAALEAIKSGVRDYQNNNKSS